MRGIRDSGLRRIVAFLRRGDARLPPCSAGSTPNHSTTDDWLSVTNFLEPETEAKDRPVQGHVKE